MRVSELIGAELDYWVIKAEGHKAEIHRDAKGDFAVRTEQLESGAVHSQFFNPSESWGDGGPIIEREGLDLEYNNETAMGEMEICWEAYRRSDCCKTSLGPTPLIAAMRWLVERVFGDTVPDQEVTK